MVKRRLIPLSMSCVVGAVFIAVSLKESAQVKPQQAVPPAKTQQVVPPLYNPYPPGILPADLESEIERVLREIDVIENRAIQRWRSLPPPNPNSDTFTGTCMTCNPATDPNCSPSRQGNGTLIPTPPLPPCAPEICGVAPVPSPPIP